MLKGFQDWFNELISFQLYKLHARMLKFYRSISTIEKQEKYFWKITW